MKALSPGNSTPARRVRRAGAALVLHGLILLQAVRVAGGTAAAAGPDDGGTPPPPAAGAAFERPVPLADRSGADAGVSATAGARPARAPLSREGGMLVWIALAGAALVAARVVQRRATPSLPPDVFVLLGEAPLGGTHVARVVRFGPKTLLVGMTGSTCTTLAEIDDPAVGAALVAACRGPAPSVASSPSCADPPSPLERLRAALPRPTLSSPRVETVR